MTLKAHNGIPRIFDRHRIARQRIRAAHSPGTPFLIDRICADIAERLELIKRSFAAGVVIGAHRTRLAQQLTASGKAAWLAEADLAYRLVSDNAMHKQAKHGAKQAPGQGGPGFVADEEWLPLAPASLDLIIAPFTLHLVNDLPGTLTQIRTALAPDGLFMATLPGGDSLHELRHALIAAETELRGGAAARIAPFSDIRTLGGLLQRAGFALPVVDRDLITVRYDTPFGLIDDLRGMGQSGVVTANASPPLTRAIIARMAEIYSDRFADKDSRVRATFELTHLAGWAPHPSQQKPLRPGSAQISLADVLKPEDTD